MITPEAIVTMSCTESRMLELGLRVQALLEKVTLGSSTAIVVEGPVNGVRTMFQLPANTASLKVKNRFGD